MRGTARPCPARTGACHGLKSKGCVGVKGGVVRRLDLGPQARMAAIRRDLRGMGQKRAGQAALPPFGRNHDPINDQIAGRGAGPPEARGQMAGMPAHRAPDQPELGRGRRQQPAL